MTPRTALGALHGGALLVGFAGVLGKLAATTPTVIVFARAGFAALALTLFIRWAGKRRWQALSLTHGLRQVLAGVLLCVHWVAFFLAVKTAGVAVATLGFATFPAFTVALEALLFRERVGAREMLLLALVSAGLVLVTPHFDLRSEATGGLLWGVFSGLTFALLSLANRVSAGQLPAAQAALCQNLIVTLCLAPLAAPQLTQLNPIDWLWLGLLGVFCTGLAHGLFIASLAVVKARVAAMVFTLEPVYGIAFAWLLFAETPSPRMLAGAALIVAAILLAGLKPRRQPAP
ncbi:DMT family transporter [uncultured Pseudomonas sp.]|uniref:DMT family transporter n=1 Tax=uncultured Pseudomonas sp. TaxID=114707 RepID=UPI0025DF4482|nr:DMT family transporter [uncultured Pseudomonas sp.]